MVAPVDISCHAVGDTGTSTKNINSWNGLIQPIIDGGSGLSLLHLPGVSIMAEFLSWIPLPQNFYRHHSTFSYQCHQRGSLVASGLCHYSMMILKCFIRIFPGILPSSTFVFVKQPAVEGPPDSVLPNWRLESCYSHQFF